tara:strand:- start:1588 stop:2001 length:414 start_codon:yes stop_codon:yes gene_type:complete
MENDPENFDELHKLLKLKNYEEPPPRFFNELPGKVMSQIVAEEEQRSQSWWSQLVDYFQLKPAMGTTYAAALGAIIVLAVVALKPGPNGDPSIANTGAGFNPLAPSTNLNATSSAPAGIFGPQSGTVQVGFETNRTK